MTPTKARRGLVELRLAEKGRSCGDEFSIFLGARDRLQEVSTAGGVTEKGAEVLEKFRYVK